MRLEDKVAVVTGGGSGLGREVAVAFMAEGARVVVASNVPAENEAVAAESREAIAVTVDVRDETEVMELFRSCVAGLGRLDVLVNAAGIDIQRTGEERLIENMQLDDWRRVQDVNVTGMFLCTREAIPHLRASGGGSILNFSGFGTIPVPMPQWGAYMTSKGAVEAFTKVLAVEVEQDAIRANCLQPGGGVVTGITPEWIDQEERATYHEPRVIRDLAVYLGSDESRLFTGRSFVATEWNRQRNLELCSCTACTSRTPVEWRRVVPT